MEGLKILEPHKGAFKKKAFLWGCPLIFMAEGEGRAKNLLVLEERGQKSFCVTIFYIIASVCEWSIAGKG